MGSFVDDDFYEFTSLMPFLGVSLVYREQNKIADRLTTSSSCQNNVTFWFGHVLEYVLPVS